MSDVSSQISEIRNYDKLIAYQKSKSLVRFVYQLSKNFPKTDFALRTQIQKAVISVPANIAEGQQRFSQKECIRFLYIARASLAEVRVFADIAKDINYISEEELDEANKLIDETAKLINGLINYLKSKVVVSKN